MGTLKLSWLTHPPLHRHILAHAQRVSISWGQHPTMLAFVKVSFSNLVEICSRMVFFGKYLGHETIVVCIYACIHMYMCTYVYTHNLHTCVLFIYIACAYKYIYIYIHVYRYIYIYTCVYTRMYVYVHVHTIMEGAGHSQVRVWVDYTRHLKICLANRKINILITSNLYIMGAWIHINELMTIPFYGYIIQLFTMAYVRSLSCMTGPIP